MMFLSFHGFWLVTLPQKYKTDFLSPRQLTATLLSLFSVLDLVIVNTHFQKGKASLWLAFLEYITLT